MTYALWARAPDMFDSGEARVSGSPRADPSSPREPPPPGGAGERGSERSRRWIAAAAFVGLALLVFVVTRTDLGNLLATVRGIAPRLLLLPLLAAMASYVTMALSYQGIAAAAGWRVRFSDMWRITLVANTANYLLSTGGLSGFALRMYLFTRRGIPAGNAVIISLVQTLLTNLVLLPFIIAGFALLLVSHSIMGRDLFLAAGMLAGFSGIVLAACVVVLHRRWRQRAFLVSARLADSALQRFAPHHRPSPLQLMRFQHHLNVGIDFLLGRPHEMWAPTLYIVLDWAFTLLILYASFVAIGHPIAVSYVIAGFAIGMFCSIVSFVPAGLGILEGSMAAVFASLDVPLEQAVVAVLIFRVSYYVVPLFVSIALVRPTLRV